MCCACWVSCLWSHVFCFVLILDLCLCIMSCCVHAPLCPFSVSYVLPSVSPCLLYCSLHVFSCAPPPRYLTWPPPSPLSSPVPRLFISICAFSLCFPFTPFLFIVYVCVCLLFLSCHVMSCLVMSLHGMCSLNFEFWFSDSLIWTLLFVCSLSSIFALVAALPFVPLSVFFWHRTSLVFVSFSFC